MPELPGTRGVYSGSAGNLDAGDKIAGATGLPGKTGFRVLGA